MCTCRCQWFVEWKKTVRECVACKQDNYVIFKRGRCKDGKGERTYDGLGFSQMGEVGAAFPGRHSPSPLQPVERRLPNPVPAHLLAVHALPGGLDGVAGLQDEALLG